MLAWPARTPGVRLAGGLRVVSSECKASTRASRSAGARPPSSVANCHIVEAVKANNRHLNEWERPLFIKLLFVNLILSTSVAR